MTPAERGAALARRRAASGALARVASAQALPAERRAARDLAAEQARQLRAAARAGVQVVSAPQLFPTPPELAAQVVELAGIEPGMRVLEPSAGTGRLLDQIPTGCDVHAVEVSSALARQLATRYPTAQVRALDFLQLQPDPAALFDRIVMNPPFGNAQDIAHIRHALQFLKLGGRLVAICAAGPRQRAALAPLGDWEDLPPGSFASEGTGVRAALLVVDA